MPSIPEGEGRRDYLLVCFSLITVLTTVLTKREDIFFVFHVQTGWACRKRRFR